MNYRHAYHAGNFADVVKHATLALVLDHLRAKDKPIAVLDTHAGIGRYDLQAIEAEKTGEYRDGILRVIDRPHPALAPYLGVVAAMNPGRPAPRLYPGSPELIVRLTRPADRIHLAELHPEDAATLATSYAHDPRVSVTNQDGYIALKALLPPEPRRGLGPSSGPSSRSPARPPLHCRRRQRCCARRDSRRRWARSPIPSPRSRRCRRQRPAKATRSWSPPLPRR